VGSDVPENVEITLHLEGNTIPLTHAQFPDLVCPLHLFGVKRGVAGVREEEIEFVVDLLLDGFWQVPVAADEDLSWKKFHGRRSDFLRASTLRKGPRVLPLAMSISASLSASCHSLVQK